MGLTLEQKAAVLVGTTLLRKDAEERHGEGAVHALYAWRPGSDDVKLIAAINDESAARIAIRIRIEGGMSEREAVDHVCRKDDLRRIDPDLVFQGDPKVALWDGAEKVGWAVQKV